MLIQKLANFWHSENASFSKKIIWFSPVVFALCATILNPIKVFAEDSLSISISSGGSLAFSVDQGMTNSVTETITASTTNLSGYNIAIKTTGGTSLSYVGNNNATIPAVTLPSGNTTGIPLASFDSTAYGYSLNGTNYLPISDAALTAGGQGLIQTSTAGTNTYSLSFGAYVDIGIPYGQYTRTYQLLITANPSGYAIYYEPNTTDSVLNMPTSPVPEAISATETTIPSQVPTRTGYIFLGWSKDQNASVATYEPGDTMLLDLNDGTTVNLYAIWTPITYQIVFNSNAPQGKTVTGSMSNQNFTYGTAQALTTNAYGITDHQFLGWNTSADGTGTAYEDAEQVNNLTTTNNATITLYAQWFHGFKFDGSCAFDGQGNVTGDCAKYATGGVINTGVTLFNQTNAAKDFTVEFTINSFGTSQTTQATLFSSKDENGSSPWPGVHLRASNPTTLQLRAAYTGSTVARTVPTTAGTKIIIKKKDGELTYSTNGGTTFTKMIDFSGFNRYFNYTATIGGIINSSGTPARFIEASISDFKLEIYDATTYLVQYDTQGGSTPPASHRMEVEGGELSIIVPTKANNMFECWNTMSNGTGTCYYPGETVDHIGTPGGVITLYAIWVPPVSYTVVFHDNTVADNTVEQELTYGDGQTLDANTFTNGTKQFVKWSTTADGTGKDYFDEEQIITGLTETANDTVDLYAIWADSVYVPNQNVLTFDGTNYLNTGVRLFDSTNFGKDFEIIFNIDSMGTNAVQNTVVSSMDETGQPWPGFSFRLGETGQYEFAANASSASSDRVRKYFTGESNKVSIKRVNNILYGKLNNGTEQMIINYANLAGPFNTAVWVGAAPSDNGTTPRRFFVGQISNFKIAISDPTPAPEPDPEPAPEPAPEPDPGD